MRKPIFLFIFFLFFSALPLLSFAKTINLYDQPKADAKVLQTIDLSAGFVPIFTPKEGGWMKVGDPKNGNVGWIKLSDLDNAGPSSITVTQQISHDGKTPNASQVVQFGQPTNEQLQIQRMNMQKAAQEMIQNMSKLLNGNYKLMNNGGPLPVVVPIDTPPSQPLPSSAPVNKQ